MPKFFMFGLIFIFSQCLWAMPIFKSGETKLRDGNSVEVLLSFDADFYKAYIKGIRTPKEGEKSVFCETFLEGSYSVANSYAYMIGLGTAEILNCPSFNGCLDLLITESFQKIAVIDQPLSLALTETEYPQVSPNLPSCK